MMIGVPVTGTSWQKVGGKTWGPFIVLLLQQISTAAPSSISDQSVGVRRPTNCPFVNEYAWLPPELPSLYNGPPPCNIGARSVIVQVYATLGFPPANATTVIAEARIKTPNRTSIFTHWPFSFYGLGRNNRMCVESWMVGAVPSKDRLLWIFAGALQPEARTCEVTVLGNRQILGAPLLNLTMEETQIRFLRKRETIMRSLRYSGSLEIVRMWQG